MARAPARSEGSGAVSVEFGRRIRSLREQLEGKVSQEQLAEIAGVHRTYIGHLELGKGSPTLDTIVRIARALKVDAALLVEGLQDL
jgi:transcriptional regulator with XRE-family HTH domain